MIQVTFTSALHRHTHAPESSVDAQTVRAALEAVFTKEPALRSYVLDDQGGLRPHVDVFVGGARIRDRKSLSDAVTDGAVVSVMQALSGG